MRIAAVVILAAGCRLGPLGDDLPGASANLLPRGATVPSVTDNHDLASQIALNDGLRDASPDAAILVPRGTGESAGQVVRYWSFGAATSAPSPQYQFFAADAAGALKPIDHPGMIDALPGDHGYSPLHSLFQVVVTDAYAGQLITTPAALADAIELGLIHEPTATGDFVASPVVLPGTALEVADGQTAAPVTLYGRGYAVAAFRFGGELGVQPGSNLIPSSDVSFLRKAMAASYDTSRPIFQATIPIAAPTGQSSNYTPLSDVIDVDLAVGQDPQAITSDAQLFVRSASGRITGTTAAVAAFRVTGDSLLLQLQFTEGQP